MIKKITLPLAAGILCLACNTQGRIGKTVPVVAQVKDTVKTDTVKKLKPYKEVITAKAVSQKGLFTVHQVDQRWFFEISDSLIDKDILVVNRISKAPAAGMGGYGGDWIGENVVRFAKGPNHRVFLERMSYVDVSKDSSANGMIRSILNSNLAPIVASFDVKAVTPDSSASVIDITDYISSDNDILFFNAGVKKIFEITGLQTDKSYVAGIRSFPLNVEIKTVKTYSNTVGPVTFELNNSFVLLPAEKMEPRLMDKRVGYFARGYLNYDAPTGVKVNNMITRWKLQPRKEDIAKYLRGELVEPEKPIVFYIDPATPKKWVPYLIEGVGAWQKAFEKAGFKNAIYAKEAPANDPDWSMEDARHNVIVYKASPVQNASGPQVSDPRTGEILESHINWYHNIQQVMHDMYFVQASPNDPAARTMDFNDTLMGKLISYVCTHEVGHTLGLQHNFIASSMVPTDSLRSRHYVALNGHTPSIMDYARFNYVAQPEDSIPVNDLIPRIGVYDEWAIDWGYRWFPGFASQEAEDTYFNQWVIKRTEADKRLTFIDNAAPDPRNQMEDLGDDAVKSGMYGIRNLQRIMIHLKEWTRKPNQDYSNLNKMYDRVVGQYKNYLAHVYKNIGLMLNNPQTVEQGGPYYTFQSREKILSAVNFFGKELFTTPDWLFNTDMFTMGTGGGMIMLQRCQEIFVGALQEPMLWNWLYFNETSLPKDKSFGYDELMTILEKEIFKELDAHKPIDVTRRNLQKTYITQTVWNLRVCLPGTGGMFDVGQIIESHLKEMNARVVKALPYYKDRESRAHLEFMREKLEMMIAFPKKNFPEDLRISNFPGSALKKLGFQPGEAVSYPVPDWNKNSCWDGEVPLN